MLPSFLGSVSLFLVLLAFAMRGLPFPKAAPAPHCASMGAPCQIASVLASSAAVFFLYPGAETAVGGVGLAPMFRDLDPWKQTWRL